MCSEKFPEASISLMEEVFRDLVEGCDSQVGPPGDSKTLFPNSFEDPSVDIPRIADALSSEVKSGHMAGPFLPGHVKDAKVNGFLSIVNLCPLFSNTL